ncbi:MAG: hypothetical protein AB7H66_04425 [Hyphomonadaceae bacterium]
MLGWVFGIAAFIAACLTIGFQQENEERMRRGEGSLGHAWRVVLLGLITGGLIWAAVSFGD